FAGTAYAEVARERLASLEGAASARALTNAEIPALLEFLVVNDRVLPDAVAALPAGDQMSAVMVLGDHRNELYLSVLRHAIVGRYGDGAARSALKRIGSFLERPDVQGSLEIAAASPLREELGPYLTSVLDRLPAGWDAPRTGAAPAYRGSGRVD